MPGIKDLIQWGAAILLIAASSRLRLAPVFGYLFAWQLPFMLLNQRALLPYTLALWALPLGAMVACLSARFCPKPSRYSKMAMLAGLLLYGDLLVTYSLSESWSVYQQLLTFGFGLTCAFTLRSKAEFWACALMVGLYLAAESLGYVFQGQQLANTDLLGVDRSVNEVIGDRNYKAFGFAVGVMLGVSVAAYSKSAFSDIQLPQFLASMLRPLAKAVGAGIVITCGYALLQSQSRSGVIILTVAFLGYALHSVWRSTNAWKAVCVLFSVAMLAFLATGPLLSGLGQRFADADLSTAGGRVEIWQDALQTVTTRDGTSLFFGYGPAGTEEVIGCSPHNGFLRMLCDQGLFGLCCFATLLTAVTWNSWSAGGSMGHLQFSLAVLLVTGSFSIEPHYFLPTTGIILGLCWIKFDPEPECRPVTWSTQTEQRVLAGAAPMRASFRS